MNKNLFLVFAGFTVLFVILTFVSIYFFLGAIVSATLAGYFEHMAPEEEDESSTVGDEDFSEYTPESLALARKQGLMMLLDYYVDNLSENSEKGSDFDTALIGTLIEFSKGWCEPNPDTGEYLPVPKIEKEEVNLTWDT